MRGPSVADTDWRMSARIQWRLPTEGFGVAGLQIAVHLVLAGAVRSKPFTQRGVVCSKFTECHYASKLVADAHKAAHPSAQLSEAVNSISAGTKVSRS